MKTATAKLKLNINKVRLIQVLFLLIIVLIFTYVYLINMITFDIAQNTSIKNNTAILNTEISDLELNIVENKKNLNYALAQEIGLTQDIEDRTIFVVRSDTRLTLNE